MNSTFVLSALTASLLSLSGCATIIKGQSQEISIDTGNECDARCTLNNDKGTWHVDSTPAKVSVSRDAGDLTVSCQNAKKYGQKIVSSSATPELLGNAVLPGSVLTTAIDVASGSAFDYPEKIEVKLDSKQQS